MQDNWSTASQGNDVSSLSGMKIPNTAERMNDELRDIAQNAMDNAAADKGAAEHDKCKTCNGMGDIRTMGSTEDVLKYGDPGEEIIECPDCGGSGLANDRLEDVVSGTTEPDTIPYRTLDSMAQWHGTAPERPNETAKGRIYRLIKTWNEDALIIKLVDGEMRDLAAHLAGNLFPNADNQPTFQQDAVQELVGALEWAVKHLTALGTKEGEFIKNYQASTDVLAKYTRDK